MNKDKFNNELNVQWHKSVSWGKIPPQKIIQQNKASVMEFANSHIECEVVLIYTILNVETVSSIIIHQLPVFHHPFDTKVGVINTVFQKCN